MNANLSYASLLRQLRLNHHRAIETLRFLFDFLD
jgi:hypothetical protein